ncbi:MAG: hypothetical protein ACO1RX_07245 [Candidatus Sericytochromatia bacterium]
MTESVEKAAPSGSQLDMRDLFLTALTPLIIGKIGIALCGSFYAYRPGEGFGWGLVFFIGFTLVMAGRFIWRYRNYEEDM